MLIPLILLGAGRLNGFLRALTLLGRGFDERNDDERQMVAAYLIDATPPTESKSADRRCDSRGIARINARPTGQTGSAAERTTMKVTIEVDCTPEEARRVMGLPDLTPLHDHYITMMRDTMEGSVRPELLENMMKNWAPMGEAGMSFWRNMLEGRTGGKPG